MVVYGGGSSSDVDGGAEWWCMVVVIASRVTTNTSIIHIHVPGPVHSGLQIYHPHSGPCSTRVGGDKTTSQLVSTLAIFIPFLFLFSSLFLPPPSFFCARKFPLV